MTLRSEFNVAAKKLSLYLFFISKKNVKMNWFQEMLNLPCVISTYFGVWIHRPNGTEELSNELTIKNSKLWNEIDGGSGSGYALVIHQQIISHYYDCSKTCYWYALARRFPCSMFRWCVPYLELVHNLAAFNLMNEWIGQCEKSQNNHSNSHVKWKWCIKSIVSF